jgi:hypothetical protein
LLHSSEGMSCSGEISWLGYPATSSDLLLLIFCHVRVWNFLELLLNSLSPWMSHRDWCQFRSVSGENYVTIIWSHLNSGHFIFSAWSEYTHIKKILIRCSLCNNIISKIKSQHQE